MAPTRRKRPTAENSTGELAWQAFGVTEPTSGTDTTSLRTFAKKEGDLTWSNGQKVWTSRRNIPTMLLLARTTPRDQAAKRPTACQPSSSTCGTHLGKGLTIRPIRTMMNHNTTEVFFDNIIVRRRNLIVSKVADSATFWME